MYFWLPNMNPNKYCIFICCILLLDKKIADNISSCIAVVEFSGIINKTEHVFLTHILLVLLYDIPLFFSFVVEWVYSGSSIPYLRYPLLGLTNVLEYFYGDYSILLTDRTLWLCSIFCIVLCLLSTEKSPAVHWTFDYLIL